MTELGRGSPAAGGRWLGKPIEEAKIFKSGQSTDDCLLQYLTRLVDEIDSLEFGDPSEYLAATAGSRVEPSLLTDVWVMPMVREIRLGDSLHDGIAQTSVPIPLERVIFGRKERIQIPLGEAGSGNSTACRYLGARFGRAVLTSSNADLLIPIVVPARQLTAAPSGDFDEKLVVSALDAVFGIPNRIRRSLTEALLEILPRAYILIDGLDEVPLDTEQDYCGAGRDDILRGVREFSNTYPQSRVFITSRISDYKASKSETPPFGFHYLLDRFERTQVEESIEKWHGVVAESARHRGIELPMWQSRKRVLLEIIRTDYDLGELAAVPLLLGLMQMVFRLEDDFPRNTSQLATRAIDFLLIEGPSLKRLGDDTLRNLLKASGAQVLLTGLRKLAFTATTHIAEGDRSEFATGDLYQAMEESAEEIAETTHSRISESGLGELTRHLRRGHGILTQVAPRQFEFTHNVFRELLTGQHLDRIPLEDLKRCSSDVRWSFPLRYWASWRAREVVSAGHVCLVCEELLSQTAETKRSHQTVMTLAVSEMVTELSRPGSALLGWATLETLRATVVGLLVDLLDDKSLELRHRIRIGDLLAGLGDPRLIGVTTNASEWLKSLIVMPTADVQLGRATPHVASREKYRLVPAAPALIVNITQFSIGRVPVVNSDFAYFIEDDGYRRSENWVATEAARWAAQDEEFLRELRALIGKEIRFHYQTELLAERISIEDLDAIADRLTRRREPLYWSSPQLNRSNQPVGGIYYWEASECCAWLTRQLRQNGFIDGDLLVRLPTEFEWEYTARRGTTDAYPWGSAAPYDPPLAHVHHPDGRANVARTCAVGLFPFARWSGGSLDMVGNVWEWTSSSPRPYSKPITQDSSGMAERVTRGGSWLSQELDSPQVTFRTFDPPFNAYEDLGMRVILARVDGASIV